MRIGHGLQYLPNLLALDVAHNNIGQEGGRALADGLQYTPFLQFLNVRDSPLDEGSTAIANALRHIPRLKTLLFTRCGMGLSTVSVLATALPVLRDLDVIAFEGFVGDHGLAMAPAIAAFCHLPRLRYLLIDYLVDVNGASELAAQLPRLESLETLALWLSAMHPGKAALIPLSSAYSLWRATTSKMCVGVLNHCGTRRRGWA